ncbi:uncharacterized protein C8R40DRAFT_1176901 [Lentinula edodes]|uniref:uncharacterized protein n=1 Tax=Lentinula edodes TaxID=5353 RepID=UPI001E8DE6DA|nr:uncharacterized protein C8R40DRAFT_1176901 [Lentinula edodes]KAH7869238.1 hypothetical protein C8R40DRAFT_1176901 [Lentinula edodes]
MSKSKRERLEFEKATTRRRQVSRFLDVSAQEGNDSEDEDEYEDEEFYNEDDNENIIEKREWPAEWVSHYQEGVHGADTPLRAVTPLNDERANYLHTPTLSSVYDSVQTPLRSETPLRAETPLRVNTPPLHVITSTSLVDNTTAPKITTEESAEPPSRSHTPERMTEQGPRVFQNIIEMIEARCISSSRDSPPTDMPVLSSSPSSTSLVKMDDETEAPMIHGFPLDTLIKFLNQPAASSLFSSYPLFLVRVQRGKEISIYRRIAADLLQDIPSPNLLFPPTRTLIAGVYRSRLPGWLYLQVPNMSSANTPLATYLHHVEGFLYNRRPSNPSAQKDRTIWRDAKLPVFWQTSNLGMPIHHLIPRGDSLLELNHVSLKFPPGSWVEIRNHLYKGDVGCVISSDNDDRMKDAGETMRLVLLIPRLPTNARILDDFLKEQKKLQKRLRRSGRGRTSLFPIRPEPALFDIEFTQTFAASVKIQRPQHVGCFDCNDPQSCFPFHRSLYWYLEHLLEARLTTVVLDESDMKKAPPFMDPKLFDMFADSRHPLLNSIATSAMPPPSNWIFEQHDRVRVAHFDGNKLPLHSNFMRLQDLDGVLEEVLELECVVAFGEFDRERIPKVLLRKSFSVGDCVQTPDQDFVGLVIGDGEKPWSKVVFSHSLSLSFHVNVLRQVSEGKALPIHQDTGAEHGPNLPSGSVNNFAEVSPEAPYISKHEQNSLNRKPLSIEKNANTPTPPWLGFRCICIRHSARKGFHAVVKDVGRDLSLKSGLKVLISYDNPNFPEDWVDYDDLRCQETFRFLDDDSIQKEEKRDSYYHFKSGYQPRYTKYETDVLQEARLANEKADMEAQFKHSAHAELSRAVSHPIPTSADNWLLDPRFKLSLGFLEFHVIIRRGPYASDPPEDIPVYLAYNIDNELQVYLRTGRKQSDVVTVSMTDIYEPGAPKTQIIPRTIARLRGLYMIADGEEESPILNENIGKLVRRITHVADDSPEGNDLVVCKVVRVYRLPGRGMNYTEELTTEPLLTVPRRYLVEVEESEYMRQKGNSLVAQIRLKAQPPGQVMQLDLDFSGRRTKKRKHKDRS